ncbi:hypothetical protein FNW02_05575 [Komarekiella sp. 'clone 1']|uniref:Uncharacterized protein n=1 Tax=Komarekiella delphini-convector SJRDD-AB1 TaxID=2593771 RepID=A0AA40SU65_9NOST|nr:hypothetical protein [Komarekiella delphini-convector]MBD6615326.1 hypothetical protein [Komarekiella delphini-convector SJRDD-AB1]
MNEEITVGEAIDLLFHPASFQEAIRIEDEADCDVTAGLDWGTAISALLKNPGLLGRMTQLRVSLNREIRHLLSEWNLGVGEEAAVVVARSLLLSRLKSPSASVLPTLEGILMQNDLYGEEFIQNSNILRQLLGVLLVESDWEDIATAAANAVRMQVIQRVSA